jgi:hypothetical protein
MFVPEVCCLRRVKRREKNFKNKVLRDFPELLVLLLSVSAVAPAARPPLLTTDGDDESSSPSPSIGWLPMLFSSPKKSCHLLSLSYRCGLLPPFLPLLVADGVSHCCSQLLRTAGRSRIMLPSIPSMLVLVLLFLSFFCFSW